jgi:hypothetical protein
LPNEIYSLAQGGNGYRRATREGLILLESGAIEEEKEEEIHSQNMVDKKL